MSHVDFRMVFFLVVPNCVAKMHDYRSQACINYIMQNEPN